MMNIEQNSIFNDKIVKEKCKICGGEGTIEIFRHDLGEFEEFIKEIKKNDKEKNHK